MSFLDRFWKKQTREQLQAKGKKADEVSVAATAEGQETKDDKRQKQEHHAAVPGARSAHRILVRQMITEKASMIEKHGHYLFHVARNANKPSIMQAVKELYGIWPERVQIINNEGKHVRFGRQHGTRKSWKKAIVVLPKGKTLSTAKSAENV